MAGDMKDESAASFLGALISLTSRSNVRYQGVLSSIDAAQATLALEKEGRCAAAGQPQDEVDGSEKVYDYIVFRAADVVDLRIDDPSPPKSESQSPGFQSTEPPPSTGAKHTQNLDPAYAPNMQMPQHPSNPYDGMYGSPMYGMPPPGYGHAPYMGGYPSALPPPMHQQSPYQPMPYNPYMLQNHDQFPTGTQMPMPPNAMPASSDNFSSSAQAGTPLSASKSQLEDAQSRFSTMQINQGSVPQPDALNRASSNTSESVSAKSAPGAHPTSPPETSSRRQSESQSSTTQPARSEASAGGKSGEEKSRKAKQPSKAKGQSQATNDQVSEQNTPGQLAAPAVNHAQVQQREARTVPGALAGKPVASNDASVPSQEFDFEKANAKFAKELREPSKSEEVAKLDAIPAPINEKNAGGFYDKKSGFFDNISSDVRDHYERRPTADIGKTRAADERARNMQTFGDNAASYRGSNTSRSRGRGRGGRGGRGQSRYKQNEKPEWADA
ncbi:hypothetical protein MPSI1_003177 [Malassezia psittaci]|uniref:Uncharacterized protein n=1 Tax=Malassezia psittaci TaxID=1821823 RepID=A0AAF0FDH7_9BASI|nr:hypothetical protein MPSI1_003177 [Malassezia psittaci]